LRQQRGDDPIDPTYVLRRRLSVTGSTAGGTYALRTGFVIAGYSRGHSVAAMIVDTSAVM
jgi:hypothetical protein